MIETDIVVGTGLRISCSKDELVQGLSVVSRAVSTRTSVQILSGILLEARGSELQLAATDMELSLRATVSAQVEGDGAIVLPGRTLVDIARLLPSDEVSIKRIQELVSERFSLSLEELCGDKRSQNIVYPRQVAMYLSRELTDSSLPKIGKEFGGRDHTTVIHATSKIARLIREDRSVYNLVQELTARVKQVR